MVESDIDLNYIKCKLEMIRNHLFDDHLEIALYNIGYLSCYIDSFIEEEDEENE
jgi:hypothetical protein